MSVRYCRPGALIGVVSPFASPFSLPATIQAVTETDLLAMRASELVAAIGQQQLADAVGTVREVVVRALRSSVRRACFGRNTQGSSSSALASPPSPR